MTSDPTDVTIEKDVAIPMRDGTILRADVYRANATEPVPALVLRTPYNKLTSRENIFFQCERLARAGYIVVLQDVRGRYSSEGEWESYYHSDTHEGADGYDTVEWAAKLHGSSGRVGTFGLSYDAWLQWKLAELRPPSLTAMCAFSIPPSLPALEGPGTIRPGRRLDWWICTIVPDLRRRSGRPGPHTPNEARAVWQTMDYEKWLWYLPWTDIPEYLLDNATDEFRTWFSHRDEDPWQLQRAHREIDVPALHVTGWYDHCLAIDHFSGVITNGRNERVRKSQRLIIGPWGHGNIGKRTSGQIDFGPQAEIDLTALIVRWFDHWTKGIPNGVDLDSPVRAFVMGENRWRSEEKWPPEHLRDMVFFLDTNGHANTPLGDGRLILKAPSHQGSSEYTYDPRDPVMSLYGEEKYTLCTDQNPLRHRQDILVFSTDPLKEDFEVTGYPKMTLYASSSAPDTDFFARLVDVYPSGQALDTCMGVVRARYRRSLKVPVLLKPGEVTEYQINFSPTSNLFGINHRIRLDITSSDFPNYDRNHNTGRDDNSDSALNIARQRVFSGGRFASKLILPVVPRTSSKI